VTRGNYVAKEDTKERIAEGEERKSKERKRLRRTSGI